ncbi:hypothetical protein D9M73_138850 [compost metagenome]
MGEGVEEPGEERGAGIAQQTATQHPWADFLAGDLAQRKKHPGGLDENDHHHQAHRQDRCEFEFRHAEVQWGDELQPWRLRHAAEVDHAEQAAEHIAQAHADQHGNIDPEAAHETVHQQDGAQHQGGDGQVDRRAELSGAGTAASPVHGHGEQRQTDRGDDRAGHQRREEAHDLGHEWGDEHAEETGGDGRAEDPLQADTGHAGHGDHAADGGETGAHHHRHANAHGADADGLDDGGDAGNQQVGIDQEGDFFTGQTGGLADDQGYGDGATVHQQDMLETDKQQLQQRQALVSGRKGDFSLCRWGHATPRALLFF